MTVVIWIVKMKSNENIGIIQLVINSESEVHKISLVNSQDYLKYYLNCPKKTQLLIFMDMGSIISYEWGLFLYAKCDVKLS